MHFFIQPGTSNTNINDESVANIARVFPGRIGIINNDCIQPGKLLSTKYQALLKKVGFGIQSNHGDQKRIVLDLEAICDTGDKMHNLQIGELHEKQKLVQYSIDSIRTAQNEARHKLGTLTKLLNNYEAQIDEEQYMQGELRKIVGDVASLQRAIAPPIYRS